MNDVSYKIERTTRETDISLVFYPDMHEPIEISTGIPFLDHMMNAMAFHGGFGLVVSAKGDLEVEYHHLVEDLGLVFGDAIRAAREQRGTITRFGHAVIPMDDALSEVTIDISNRPYLVYNASYPQEYCGNFPVVLFREFFLALSQRGGINLHLWCRYGENSHHMTEALFKALGKALSAALRISDTSHSGVSTKGTL
jgi:imidazoleglycerol-phosphate dehydratase